ncbi:probable malonyl-CoA-acyl carrier protein transacylase, mitochondrial [Neocloeon triangulifer]|uniref:probable malonyl-CoA-acyl carrier protein transacylase, mitochondrial n=1 Tax=Neocloeon triangulifer TaxID=2078957 RepID=UPI00286F06EE|nr:probable malonyl-CoA-acyl carrier protein transacylase, mitochondrial [Neocloeon triangulifer]
MSGVFGQRIRVYREAINFYNQSSKIFKSQVSAVQLSCRSYARGSRGNKEPPADGGGDTDLNTKEVQNLLKHSTVGYPQDFLGPDHTWQTNPYKEDPSLERRLKERNQAGHAFRPKVNPSDTSILIFPGQGVQYVGMCKELLKFRLVQDLFEAASSILNYDLLKLCLEGPKDKLDETKYCQPAVVVSSLAAVEWLKEERPSAIEGCVATAGFSIGEITALIFAGAISFESAIKLVRARAEGMQYASEMVNSGMATVIYGPDSQLGVACNKAVEHCLERRIERPVCQVANYLYPHCKVVAGNVEALDFLAKNASKFNLRKVRRLPVSGAFHTPLMEPALEPFKAALRKVQVQDPLVYVHSNVDGKYYSNAKQIRKLLPLQIVKPVKWEQTLHVLFERPEGESFPRTFECGPGKSLRAILKQVNSKAYDTSFSYSS